MRVDPELSRRKFALEHNKLTEQRGLLEKRGIFVLASSTFPYVEVFYAPRGPLRVLLPPPPGMPTPPGAMAMFEVPSLAAAGFKARFDLTDYDLVAPSLEFLDPVTNQALKYETMFRAFEFEKQRGAHEVLLPSHPNTNRPFLCLRGIREYHEHPQHVGDDWLLYRDQMSLFTLIIAVWRVTVDLVRSQISPIQTSGQLAIHIGWVVPEAKQ
jgi:hypothetical protein